MSESRDHICPRCGSYLPTVTVRVPVYEEATFLEGSRAVTRRILARYEEREDVADCVRCTGSY